jgi:hypothetical protein
MNQPVDQIEYLQPDPTLRRAALITVVAGVGLGVVAMTWFLPRLELTLLNARARGTLTFPLACFLFLGLIVALAAPVIWFGVYMVRFGRRVLASGQYPPPGARVIRRTPIVRVLPVVRFTGRAQQVLGSALVLCGIALLVLAGWGLVIIAR